MVCSLKKGLSSSRRSESVASLKPTSIRSSYQLPKVDPRWHIQSITMSANGTAPRNIRRVRWTSPFLSLSASHFYLSHPTCPTQAIDLLPKLYAQRPSRAPHPSILCPCRASSITSSGRQLRREWTITLSSSYSLPLWKVGSQDLAGFPPQHCVRVLWICHGPAPGQLGVGVAFPGLPSISIS